MKNRCGGFLLPLALMGLLALTALAVLSFTLAFGLVQDTVLERQYLEGWIEARPVDSLHLGGGYTLVRLAWHDGSAGTSGNTESGGSGRSTWWVIRTLDPVLDSRRWRSPVYTPILVAPESESSIAWAPSPCGGGATDANPGAGPLLHLADPLLDVLLAAGTDRETFVEVQGVEISVPALSLVVGPGDIGWLFTDGDVEVRGEGIVEGVLLGRGRVTIGAGVQWRGGVASSVGVRLEGDGSIIGDWCVIENAIASLAPPRRVALPGGGPLGRF
jgi:hypothetical protein